MTTTVSGPTVIPAHVDTDERVKPAVLRDDSGLYILKNGQRVPLNAPGIVILDGTPAESAYATLLSLDTAKDALDAQIEVQKSIVKAVIGEHGVALLHGQHVIDWKYGSETRTNSGIVKALLSASEWALAATTSYRRPFILKVKQSR